jgi:hypothetical protein
MQTPNYYSKYTTITQQGKKPKADDEPWGSLLCFTTQNKPIEDDDEPFDSLLSFAIQEKNKMTMRCIRFYFLP